MITSVLALFALAITAPPPKGGVHSVEVEARLGRLIGEWTIQGLTGKQYRQKCSWFGAKAFVLCSIDDKRSGVTGQFSFGYSAPEKRFTYSLYDTTGKSARLTGFPSGEYGLTFIDERPDAKGPARIQASVMVEDDGIHYLEQHSVAGGEWHRVVEYVLVPVKGAPAARRRR